jgi:catechol 2,3-dioxygenase-like lactoylglutathione lyase family enzyme
MPARPRRDQTRINAPTVCRVKTLQSAYRVTDLAVSLNFYCALGYQEVGRVGLGDGATLTVLKSPARRSSRLSWCTRAEQIRRARWRDVDLTLGAVELGVDPDARKSEAAHRIVPAVPPLHVLVRRVYLEAGRPEGAELVCPPPTGPECRGC